VPFDSHQPEGRTSNFVPGKREAMLAAWRGSMQHDLAAANEPQHGLEQRWTELLANKEQSQLNKQQHEANQQHRDLTFNQAMRSSDMQALHRQVMKKMQAKAGKHV